MRLILLIWHETLDFSSLVKVKLEKNRWKFCSAHSVLMSKNACKMHKVCRKGAEHEYIMAFEKDKSY